LSPKHSTHEGIIIQVNPLPENAWTSICTNFDSSWNPTGKTDLRVQVQDSKSISTVDAMPRSLNPLWLNACVSTQNNQDMGSNLTEKSDLQIQKQPAK
jgi:hypothetical protein